MSNVQRGASPSTTSTSMSLSVASQLAEEVKLGGGRDDASGLMLNIQLKLRVEENEVDDPRAA